MDSNRRDDENGERPVAGGAFPTTQWSMVLHAGGSTSTESHAALESLCQQYWYPLYAFVRRQGRAHHEAEDCTQEFLGKLLASDGLARARPERGRFRSFLLTGLRNFMTSEWRRTQAEKRGGGQVAVSLDLRDAESRFSHDPVDTGLTPEQAFDRSWARGMIEHAIVGLRAEYAKSGRGDAFEALLPLVWGNDSEDTLAGHAELIGMSGRAFTMALHRLRQRIGERLREEVAQTVADNADVDMELRHLIGTLSDVRSSG